MQLGLDTELEKNEFLFMRIILFYISLRKTFST